jgi:hypothetical protein
MGRTATEAIVRGRPEAQRSPKVIAVAATATSSGSSRRRARKTSRSVSAITTSAAASSTAIEAEIASVSSSTTTGAPVTTYAPGPDDSRQSGIATARRMEASASARARGTARAAGAPDQRRVPRGEQVREALLRGARGPAGVEDERGDEARVVHPRHGGDAVAQGELRGVAQDSLRTSSRARAATSSRAGLGPAALAREPPGARAALSPRSRAAADPLATSSWILPTDSLTNVPGPKTTCTGRVRARRAQGPPRPPGQRAAGGRGAGQAALEADRLEQVLREHEPGDGPAHQDVDRVVAERLVVARGRLERRGVRVGERVRGRLGVQPQRRHPAEQREQRDEPRHEPGAADGGAHDGGQEPPCAVDLHRGAA